MAIKLIKQQELEDGVKIRLRFNITGAQKRQLAIEALQSLAKEAEIEIPGNEEELYNTLVKQFGEEAVEGHMAAYVCMRASLPEVKKQGLDILFNPEPAVKKIPNLLQPTDATIEADVYIHPKYELSSYEPVYVHVPTPEVGEREINAQLMRELNQFATYEENDLPVQAGDCVQVNMSTLANGVPQMHLSGDGLAIVLDASVVPQGFVDGMSGMEKGEHKEFEFEHTEVDGSHTTYKVAVDVLDKRKRTAPELTDEFVSSRLSQTDKTVEQFRARVKKHLENDAIKQKKENADDLVVKELGKRLCGTIPNVLIEHTAQNMLETMAQNAKAQNMTLEQFAKAQGQSTQQFQMNVMSQARESLRQGFALDALFEYENLELTDADFDLALHEMAPGSEDVARRNFQDNDAWFILKSMAKRYKAHTFLMDNAVVE